MKADYRNEKFNEEWKYKLEDTSGLTHATLQHTDAAWEKLYARLDKKKQKHFGWYWIAAACLLMVIIIPLTIHKPAVITKENVVATNKNSPVIKNKSVNNYDKITTALINQTKKQIQKNDKRKADENKTVIMNTVADNSTETNNNIIPQTNEITISPLNNDTNSVTQISPIQTQKKLKVVHINELGEPIEFNADIAHKTDLHLFQLKLAQQEIYNASSTAANYNYTPFFKPKKSSN